RVRSKQLDLQPTPRQPAGRINAPIAEPQLSGIVDDVAVVDVGVAPRQPATKCPAVAHPPVDVEVAAIVDLLVVAVLAGPRAEVVHERPLRVFDHVKPADGLAANGGRQTRIVRNHNRELVEVRGRPQGVVGTAAEKAGGYGGARGEQYVEVLDVSVRRAHTKAWSQFVLQRERVVPVAPACPKAIDVVG